MRYDNLRAFEKHLENASPRLFSSLYFILGKEAFDCQEAAHLLLRFLLPLQQEREVALLTLDGSALEEKELALALHSYSLFAASRVVWIQQGEKLKKNIQETLEKYITRPQPSQYLMLTASGVQKSHSLYKVIEKEGVILEFPDIKPWEKEKRLVEWVNKQMAIHRKLASYPVCQHLVKKIGHDHFLLEQEVDKLLSYCGEKKEISMQDVETICSQMPVESIWQFGEAIFRRNSVSALQIVKNLFIEGQTLLPLLRHLRTQFQTEYQLSHLLSQGKDSQEITKEFPYMKGQILDQHVRQVQFYGSNAFKKGLLLIDETERRAKTTSLNEEILMEMLIMQLTKD